MWCQQARWSVESVHTKNIVSILHLLVALARHFRWNSCSSYFWMVVLLLMVPENSTKMVHNPLQGSYSTSGERCRGRCYRDKKRRGETRIPLSSLITHICFSSGAHSSRDRWGVDFVLRRRGDALWEGRLRHPLRPRPWQASGTWAPAYFIWTGFERWGTRLPIIQYHRSTFNLIERKKPLGL